MDDDDEIRRLIREESERFLKRALYQAKGGEGSYDLEAEFAKSRRNKSRTVIAATAITILCLTAAAFAVTRAIDHRAAAAPVSVSAFEDLNLRDVLDASKQDEAALDRARIRRARLDADLASGIGLAEREYLSSLQATEALDLAAGDRSRRDAQAASFKESDERKLRASYALAESANRAETEKAQARIDRYDSRSLAKARKEQAVLESARLAFDIEKGLQARLYESRIDGLEASSKRDLEALARSKDELAAALTSRFNPTFSDPRSASLLSDRGGIPASEPAPFDPYLASAGILDSPAQARLDASSSDLEYLASKMGAVPYVNSVPSALSRIATEARSSVATYRGALQTAVSGLEEKDAAIAARDGTIASLEARAKAAEAILERYRSRIAAIARESGGIGYVLDARGGPRLSVFLDQSVVIPDGSLGYIVRDGIVIATVSLSPRGGEDYALITRTEPNAKPRAFDAILVDLRTLTNRPSSSK